MFIFLDLRVTRCHFYLNSLFNIYQMLPLTTDGTVVLIALSHVRTSVCKKPTMALQIFTTNTPDKSTQQPSNHSGSIS